MADEGFKRKLAAILSADVEGYSRLMDDDEEATVRTLTAYRNAITDLTQQFRGRVVDFPGDNILAEFSSVVDAVNCAVEIQRELAEQNTALPYNRRMQFRIGVNLGDVIEEDGRIYGDGVNIAARVEAMAEAGGICITGRAYDQVANKLGLEYEHLGEHTVKNISTPIRIYRMLSYPGAAAHRVIKAKKSMRKKWLWAAVSTIFFLIVIFVGLYWKYFYLPTPENIDPDDKMTFDLPKGPSIAVLPFDNMSGDPEQDYLSDGLTENIITGLSRCPKLFVIARHSSFSYKGKSVNVQQVAKELGVKHVIEGSVQKTESRLRITVQLIDAATGHLMWAEKYDRNLKDIFKLQDEITIRIIRALAVKLTEGDQARIWLNRPANLEAFIKLLKAYDLYRQQIKEDNIQARKLLEESIQLDSQLPESYLLMAATYIEDIWYGTESPLFSFAQASKHLKKAMALDKDNSDAYIVLSYLFAMKRQHEEAITAAKQAITLNPNSSDAYFELGCVLYWSSRSREAINYVKKAISLNPMPPSYYFHRLGLCYLDLERFEEALKYFKKTLEITPNFLWAHFALATTYIDMGREREARAAASKVLSINPDFSTSALEKADPSIDRERVKRRCEAARKAGLPD